MKERDLAFRIVRKNPNPLNWANACLLRNRVAQEIKKARRNVILKHLRLVNGDGQKFWNFINRTFFKAVDPTITHIKKDGTILEGISAANAVNEYFCNISKILSEKFKNCQMYDTEVVTTPNCDHVPQLSVRRVSEAVNKIDISKSLGIPRIPLRLLKMALKAMPEIFTALLNLCLATATFPQDWKLAQVVCLPKGGDIMSMNNIRPISLLQISGKILESFLNERLVDHLETHGLLTDKQYGFRRGYSTTDCCLGLVDEIHKAMNSSFALLAVFVDLAKAFNTVCHPILLKKLANLGISGSFLAILEFS